MLDSTDSTHKYKVWYGDKVKEVGYSAIKFEPISGFYARAVVCHKDKNYSIAYQRVDGVYNNKGEKIENDFVVHPAYIMYGDDKNDKNDIRKRLRGLSVWQHVLQETKQLNRWSSVHMFSSCKRMPWRRFKHI